MTRWYMSYCSKNALTKAAKSKCYQQRSRNFISSNTENKWYYVRVTIKELKDSWGHEGQTVQLKDADPNEVQLFIEKMPVPIKVLNFQNFV